jgi:hypothetical protein
MKGVKEFGGVGAIVSMVMRTGNESANTKAT